MKKLALVWMCVLGLALAGTAGTVKTVNKQAPVKKETPAPKKAAHKATAKKVDVKKNMTTPVKPAAPVKK